jgi:hypothetical protein
MGEGTNSRAERSDSRGRLHVDGRRPRSGRRTGGHRADRLPGEQFAAEPADCREQLGQDHIYQIELNTDLGVSVIVEDWGSRTANLFTGDLNVVADALLRRLRAAGATDAKVLRRARPKVQGHQGLDFQISFTPLKPPRIKPIWLVRVVEDETALVFLQTIGSPKTKGTKVESTVRALQRRLIASLQLV